MTTQETTSKNQSPDGELVRYEMLLHDVYEIPVKLAGRFPAQLFCARCGGSGDVTMFHRPGCPEVLAELVN